MRTDDNTNDAEGPLGRGLDESRLGLSPSISFRLLFYPRMRMMCNSQGNGSCRECNAGKERGEKGTPEGKTCLDGSEAEAVSHQKAHIRFYKRRRERTRNTPTDVEKRDSTDKPCLCHHKGE